MQKLDEVRIARLMGLSMDRPAAYLLGVRTRERMGFFKTRVTQPAGARGSLKWMQQLVGLHPQVLTDGIRAVSKRPLKWDVDWVSPLPADEWAEYRDAGLLTKLRKPELITALAQFWPPGGPQWDALGIASDGGVVLVEAKAHFPELTSVCGAGEESRAKIARAIDAAKPAFGANAGHDWLQPYYQFANRLAHLHFLREHGVDAVLVFLYFYGDSDMAGPSSSDQWQRELDPVYEHLGLRGDLAASGIVNVFVQVPLLASAS